MLKKRMLALLVASTLALPPVAASAHFDVEDTGNDIKASFHITPDHEPEAGKNSVISFDFNEGATKAQNYTFKLNITPINGTSVTVPYVIENNAVLANYVFPSQGTYNINLQATATAGGKQSSLSYTQRVARGDKVADSSISAIEIVAIAATLLVALGAVLAVSFGKRRKTH